MKAAASGYLRKRGIYGHRTYAERPGHPSNALIPYVIEQSPRGSAARHLQPPAQRPHHLPRRADRRPRGQLGRGPALHLEPTDPDKDISLYINSPSGSVTAGLGILDTMNFISATCPPSASASAPPWPRCSSPRAPRASASCCRTPWCSSTSPWAAPRGQQTEIAIVADFMLKTRKRLNKILSENTGQSIEDSARYRARQLHDRGGGQEYGLVDEIIYHHGAMPGEEERIRPHEPSSRQLRPH